MASPLHRFGHRGRVSSRHEEPNDDDMRPVRLAKAEIISKSADIGDISLLACCSNPRAPDFNVGKLTWN
jgi:hypothetical protein